MFEQTHRAHLCAPRELCVVDAVGAWSRRRHPTASSPCKSASWSTSRCCRTSPCSAWCSTALASAFESLVAPLTFAVGPDLRGVLWSKTYVKFHTRIAHIRATPGPARERLSAYKMFASSVLHFLAFIAPPAPDLHRTEAVDVAPVLASPCVCIHPERSREHPEGPSCGRASSA